MLCVSTIQTNLLGGSNALDITLEDQCKRWILSRIVVHYRGAAWKLEDTWLVSGVIDALKRCKEILLRS